MARLFGLGDLRQIGSGNIGATNVLRTGNKPAAFLTLVLRRGKGRRRGSGRARAGRRRTRRRIAGLFAVLGHLFPVWLRFKGGKGVATFLGTLAGAVVSGRAGRLRSPGFSSLLSMPDSSLVGAGRGRCWPLSTPQSCIDCARCGSGRGAIARCWSTYATAQHPAPARRDRSRGSARQMSADRDVFSGFRRAAGAVGFGGTATRAAVIRITQDAVRLRRGSQKLACRGSSADARGGLHQRVEPMTDGLGSVLSICELTLRNALRLSHGA